MASQLTGSPLGLGDGLCSVVMVIFYVTCRRCCDRAQKPSSVELLHRCTQFTLITAWVKAGLYFVAKSHQNIGGFFVLLLFALLLFVVWS